MNPIMIIGMVAVGISLFGAFVSISDDQSLQVDASTKISEKQHERIVEASSLKASVDDNGNISIENLANIDAEILEIRVLGDDGNVMMKKTLEKPIPASRVAEMVVDSEIKTHINNIKAK